MGAAREVEPVVRPDRLTTRVEGPWVVVGLQAVEHEVHDIRALAVALLDEGLAGRNTLRAALAAAHDLERKVALARSLLTRVWPLLEQKRVRPVIHARFPLAEAAQAHALMESSQHIGKIMLAGSEDEAVAASRLGERKVLEIGDQALQEQRFLVQHVPEQEVIARAPRRHRRSTGS